MREQKTKFKIFVALLCALLIACFTCAVFSSTLHECEGEICDICTLAQLICKLFGAVALLASFYFCAKRAFAARFDGTRILRGNSTLVGLRVKLLN